MVTKRSAATAREFACVAALYLFGCCTANFSVGSPANQTRMLMADQSKIVSYNPANPAYVVTGKLYGKRFAYNALIQVIYNGTNQAVGTVCTGTLISERHVLTAAHCCVTFSNIKKIEMVYVTVGANQLNSDTLEAATGGWHGSKKAWVGWATFVYVPPEFYNASSGVIKREWGVCILLLNEDIRRAGGAIAPTAHVDKFITIEGLGKYRRLPLSLSSETYGWGSQNNANPLQASQVLKGLAVSTVSCGNGEFAGSWEPTVEALTDVSDGNRGAPYFFCTEGSLTSGALCNNDEGGPLIRPFPDRLRNLVGVFAYRVGGNDTHCIADVNGGRNLNIFVNTMAPSIYNFITEHTKI